MTIEIPEKASEIITTLEKAGFEAYAVGGCVRDSILGRVPDDWDITTSARPDQVKALFFRTIDTGIAHGTVTVMMGREGYEVTTYRLDGKYEDGRHPKDVTFTPSLIEDLKRRDFTINAMAYNPSKGLVDCFEGVSDLNQKIIRCVGEPEKRFGEDALRILRAVRFGAQLGFFIEGKTKEAIRTLAFSLDMISAERIQAELVKLLLSDHPADLRTAYELGITGIILPEFDACMKTPQNTPHHCYSVGEHILHSLEHVPSGKVLRLTMLLHDIAKPDVRTTDAEGKDHFTGHGPIGVKKAEKILRRLKLDNDTIRQVTLLVRWHDLRPEATENAVRRAAAKIGKELFPLYLMVQRADILAQSSWKREEKLSHLEEIERQYHRILEKGQCLSLKELAVTGRELIDAGFVPGKEMGMILNQLLEHVLEYPEENEREILMDLAFHFAGQGL